MEIEHCKKAASLYKKLQSLENFYYAPKNTLSVTKIIKDKYINNKQTISLNLDETLTNNIQEIINNRIQELHKEIKEL